jgi:DNA polymerase-1
MSADLSQIEWRVAADLSGDLVMIKEIWEGSDIHGENAIKFFGDMSFRKIAKFFTFRMIYGGSAYGFYKDNKMPAFSQKKWAKIVDTFSKKYHGLIGWQNDNIRRVNDKGILYIPSGRFFAFSKSYKGSFNPRHIKNYPVQGFSYDIISLAMLMIKMKMVHNNLKSKMIAQVHDEVVFDAIREEIRPLGKICLETFESIPQLMREYWGFNSKIPYAGAIKVGNDYEEMVEYDREIFIN